MKSCQICLTEMNDGLVCNHQAQVLTHLRMRAPKRFVCQPYLGST